MKRKSIRRPRPRDPAEAPRECELRIIGGQLGGRRIRYSGRAGTRPMKDRLREATFNLVGPAIDGCHAIDLFAGTGALGLEAISRGAVSATLVEQHIPTARLIRENVASLDVSGAVDVFVGDTFSWAQRNPKLPPVRWAVFCSPPYEFYTARAAEMLDLVQRFVCRAPRDSLLIVEADSRFSFDLLPNPTAWAVRAYPPAVLGLMRKEAMDHFHLDAVAPFTTKDGSEIRELLAHRNSSIRNQSLAEARLPPGAATIPHFHRETEEIYYITQGEGRMQVEDDVRAVRAGDAIAIPPGAKHQIINVGDGMLKLLCCCAPAYEDQDTVLLDDWPSDRAAP